MKEFSEVEALEFDHMMNQVTIIRKNCVPEVQYLISCLRTLLPTRAWYNKKGRGVKHGASQHNRAEGLSLSITNPNETISLVEN